MMGSNNNKHSPPIEELFPLSIIAAERAAWNRKYVAIALTPKMINLPLFLLSFLNIFITFLSLVYFALGDKAHNKVHKVFICLMHLI